MTVGFGEPDDGPCKAIVDRSCMTIGWTNLLTASVHAPILSATSHGVWNHDILCFQSVKLQKSIVEFVVVLIFSAAAENRSPIPRDCENKPHHLSRKREKS